VSDNFLVNEARCVCKILLDDDCERSSMGGKFGLNGGVLPNAELSVSLDGERFRANKSESPEGMNGAGSVQPLSDIDPKFGSASCDALVV